MAQQEYNINYIWQSLSDFWRIFEDAPVIEQLWRGYVFTVNNLYYQLYQLDLSKCIHTIPYKWLSDWELFPLDDTTAVDPPPTTYVDFPYVYKMPYGVKNVSMLRESPRETINLPAYTMLLPDGLLMTPDGFIRHPGDQFYFPTDVIKKDGFYVFPSGIAVDTLKLYPNIDYIVDQPTLTIHFKLKPYPRLWTNLAIRDLEIIYNNFGCLLQYYKPDSYKYLREVQGLWYAYWNGSTIDNIRIGINILRDYPFVFEPGIVDSINHSDSVVQIGSTNYSMTNTQLQQIQLGEVTEYVSHESSVARIGGKYYRFRQDQIANLHIGDAVVSKTASASTVVIGSTTYPIPTGQTVDVSVGSMLDKFTPLTQAIGVFDYINFPGWWRDYIGGYDELWQSCFFDGNPWFDNGNFDVGFFDATYSERCLEAIFLQYFTFLVRINQEVWFRTKEEFEVVKAFLFAIKPAYTHFLFEFILEFQDDAIAFDPTMMFGPWEFRPTDIPCDHHHFDIGVIHPTFDDGSYFDFDKERDDLWISVFGSPHIFYDDDVLGYTFDDPAVPDMDFRLGFDFGPYNDTFDLQVITKIPQNFVLSEDYDAVDSAFAAP